MTRRYYVALTEAQREAVDEALNFRLAGPIGGGEVDQRHETYEAALDAVNQSRPAGRGRAAADARRGQGAHLLRRRGGRGTAHRRPRGARLHRRTSGGRRGDPRQGQAARGPEMKKHRRQTLFETVYPNGWTIRERQRTLASPPAGKKQTWTEYQVVEGRRVIHRADLRSQAEVWIARQVARQAIAAIGQAISPVDTVSLPRESLRLRPAPDSAEARPEGELYNGGGAAMRADDYKALVARIPGLTQHRISRLLNLNKGTPSKWAQGRAPIPVAVALLLRLMAAGFVSVDLLEELVAADRARDEQLAGEAEPGKGEEP